MMGRGYPSMLWPEGIKASQTGLKINLRAWDSSCQMKSLLLLYHSYSSSIIMSNNSTYDDNLHTVWMRLHTIITVLLQYYYSCAA